ncbi:MAG: VWA domain-containing protein [Candidatus Melainabacteria bacterium]|nr:VWA domain-containing protein [Candidatus Melainabacteria bacterium]
MSDTDLVPDASRISPPRLADGLIPDLSLTISVELTPELTSNRDGRSLRISDLACSQHAVQTRTEDGVIRITLAKANNLLNRDFILRWRLVSEQITSSVVLYRKAGKEEKQEGYAMLSLVPPALAGVATAPRDVVFVLDRSGSMQGTKMVSAARSCAILMSSLGPNDRFAINAFDDHCDWYMDSPTQHLVSVGKFFDADLASVEKGVDFLKEVTARGGTELGKALVQSIDLIKGSKKRGRVPVIVVLTDGQIGNESQLFSIVQRTAGDTRIFTVGIDTVANCPFLTRLAALGTGTATFVSPGSQLEDALVQVGREIGAPLITDLEIESLTGGVTIDALAPSRLPDLFSGRASDCLFRVNCKIAAGASAKFRIRGKLANGKKYTEDVSARAINDESISRLWAREFIKELEDEYRVNPAKQQITKQQIIDLSLKFSVLTKFTAFVAVDQTEVVNMTGEVRQIMQPVHMPDQWEMQNQSGWGQASPLFGSSPPSFGQGSYGVAGGAMSQGFFHVIDQVDQTFGSGPPAGGQSASAAQWGGTSTGSFNSYGATPPSQRPDDEGWNTLAPNSDRLKHRMQSPNSSSSADAFKNWDVPIQPRGKPSGNAPTPPLTPGNPPPPPAAPAPYQQSILPASAPTTPPSNAWSTMKKLFSFGGANGKPIQSPEGAPVSRILNALKTFREAWIASWTEIGKGNVPDADAIENYRKALVEALADHPVGFEVPRLQKFLRTSAIEYVSALQAFDVTAAALYQARAQFNHGLVDAMVEGEDAMVKVQGRQGAFWESIV